VIKDNRTIEVTNKILDLAKPGNNREASRARYEHVQLLAGKVTRVARRQRELRRLMRRHRKADAGRRSEMKDNRDRRPAIRAEGTFSSDADGPSRQSSQELRQREEEAELRARRARARERAKTKKSTYAGARGLNHAAF